MLFPPYIMGSNERITFFCNTLPLRLCVWVLPLCVAKVSWYQGTTMHPYQYTGDITQTKQCSVQSSLICECGDLFLEQRSVSFFSCLPNPKNTLHPRSTCWGWLGWFFSLSPWWSSTSTLPKPPPAKETIAQLVIFIWSSINKTIIAFNSNST